MIRVLLPAHLRTLSRTGAEVLVKIEGPPTIAAALDALEAEYPMLRGTIRDQVTHRRRDFLRFFACEQDLSSLPMHALLPEEVTNGKEPLIVLGAIAGG